MNCQFTESADNDKFVLVCRFCDRPLVFTHKPAGRIQRTCTNDGSGDRHKYVFFVENDIAIHPWRIYNLTDEEIRKINLSGDYLGEDVSRIGTQLQSLFERLGYKKGGCDCEYLRQLLDDASIDFVEKYVDPLSQLIAQSARKTGYRVPQLLVKWSLQLAIHQERRRINGT